VNLLLLERADFVGERRARIGGRRLEHVRSILKSRPGDRLRAGELGGLCGEATILSLSEEALELEVSLHTPPPAPLPHALLVALPRPPALRRILQSAAALGVKDIALLGSARVEKSFWQSPLLQPAQLEHELRLGLEQALDTVLPRITLHRQLHRSLDAELAPYLQSGRALIAHPHSGTPCPRAASAPHSLWVGPEGGWLDGELDALRARGAQLVDLGPRPLRVETAVIALLARIA
jgi:RsmE family RNA methyltransferase